MKDHGDSFSRLLARKKDLLSMYRGAVIILEINCRFICPFSLKIFDNLEGSKISAIIREFWAEISCYHVMSLLLWGIVSKFHIFVDNNS